MQIMSSALAGEGVVRRVVGHETLFDILFGNRDIANYRDVKAGDTARAARFNRVLRSHGIFKAP
jgi:glutamate-1-semialdehyde 2,1-aminomutase